MLAEFGIEFLGRAGISKQGGKSWVLVGFRQGGMTLTRSVLSSTLATVMSTARPARSGMSSTNAGHPSWHNALTLTSARCVVIGKKIELIGTRQGAGRRDGAPSSGPARRDGVPHWGTVSSRRIHRHEPETDSQAVVKFYKLGVAARKNRNGKDRPEAIGCILLSTWEQEGNPVSTCRGDSSAFWLESSPYSMIQLLVGLDSFGGHHVAAYTLS